MFPRAQTTASAIESTAKGTTEPEEAVETTISAGDDAGYPAERRPADKLLLVERGGLGIMYNQNKNQRKVTERRANATRQRRGNHGRRLAKCCLAVFVVGCFYPNWELLHLARQKKPTLSDQRAPIGPAMSER